MSASFSLGDQTDIEVDMDKAYGKTGYGDQYQVLSAVVNGMKEFIHEYRPKYIVFEAETDVDASETDSRIKLYNKMVAVVGRQHGYTLKKKSTVKRSDHDSVLYTLETQKKGTT